MAGFLLIAHGSRDCQIIWLNLSGGVSEAGFLCVVYRNSLEMSTLVTITKTGLVTFSHCGLWSNMVFLLNPFPFLETAFLLIS